MNRRTLLGLLALAAAGTCVWAAATVGSRGPAIATAPAEPAAPAVVQPDGPEAPPRAAAANQAVPAAETPAPTPPPEPPPGEPKAAPRPSPSAPDRSSRPPASEEAQAPLREPVDLTPYRQTVLRPGSSGPAVEALQSELIRKHGYSLAVTGQFDGQTEAAVREFQAHMGLAVDGVVGPATWSALANHFVELEWSGPGFYRYKVYDSDSSWGTEKTVATVRRVAAQWAQRGHDVRIGVNDISLPHGGPFWPHSSHRDGRDVDFRLLRNDGREEGVAYTDPAYSRTLTQELVDLLWATGEVEKILFNDPEVRGVTPWPGHDDHLHVRFRP